MKSVQNALNRRKKGEKGFTLVELLVVVIIIGILAAVAVPIYLNQRKSAWRSSVQSDVKNASLVLETISTNNNGKISIPSDGITCSETCTLSVDDKGNITKVTTGDGDTITVSKDNTLIIAGGSKNTYKITGTNANLDEQVVYDSSTGSMSTGAKPAGTSASGQ